MTTTDTASKRPRIDNDVLAEIETAYPGMPFERATNHVIRETGNMRAIIAEMLIDLEGPRPSVAEFHKRKVDLAYESGMNGVALLRLLKMRLRDRGVEL